MFRIMCKSKLHGATVTEANLTYEGSLTIDETLMEAARILPHEQVQVVNVNNGARFETYTIVGPRGSGTICLNGPAARLGEPGDVILILSYALMDDLEAQGLKIRVVLLGKQNEIVEILEK
ncbi:MAG: aspartate 1-decarboxylase [Candidatus Latescibacteria bacterium]|nr:aspartate 1-decarboxylase [Candidatus Latescibacterota bacterium]